jgi:glutathione S-transferase
MLLNKETDNNHILYSFRRCPFAIRARLSIYFSNHRCQIREITLKNKPEEFLKISSDATVPVLLTEDGKIIEESLDIMKWYLLKNDPLDIMRPYNDEAADELIDFFDNDFKFHLDRYKYSSRFDPQKKNEHRNAAVKILSKLENKMNDSAYIHRDKISIYELSILPFVRQFMLADINWYESEFDYKKIKLSLSRLIESSAFIVTMRKYNEWTFSREEVQYFPSY